jgi:hypothetical protein
MRSKITLVAFIVLFSRPLSVHAATITGTARLLDGRTTISTIATLQVVARNVQGQVISSRTRITGNTYSIDIDEALLPSVNRSISLLFTADGQDSVQLDGIAGTLDQTIDVIMPLKKNEPCCCCCDPCERHALRCRPFGRRRW